MNDDDVPARKSSATKGAGAPAKGRDAARGTDIVKEGSVVKNAEKAAKAAQGRSQLDPAAQAHIGKQLKAIYDGVVSQPVPDRFLELLKQIDNAPRKSRKDLQ